MEASRWIRPEAAALAAADGQAGLVNREGDSAFAVRWGWADGPLEPGFTAIIRIKNEARSLPWVLPPLLAATRRVLVVDNGSTDGSAELAHEVAATNDGDDRLDHGADGSGERRALGNDIASCSDGAAAFMAEHNHQR